MEEYPWLFFCLFLNRIEIFRQIIVLLNIHNLDLSIKLLAIKEVNKTDYEKIELHKHLKLTHYENKWNDSISCRMYF